MSEYVETVIVGGGQAGLVMGYHLSQLGRSFLICDANQRTGDSWRKRWGSLRLFTPAYLNALPGLESQGPRSHCPPNDEMADYLAAFDWVDSDVFDQDGQPAHHRGITAEPGLTSLVCSS
jgi:putative flavoprotein involved in K+ transport